MGFLFRTFCLLFGLSLLFMIVGGIISALTGLSLSLTLTAAFLLALLLNFFSFWFSDRWVLKLYRVRMVSESEQPSLHGIVSKLAERAGLPKPKVGIAPLQVPNAFATGRSPKHAAVVVTEGAMRLFNEEELEGVLGHELAHVRNRDMLIGTAAAMLAAAISYLALMGRFQLMTGRRRNGGDILYLLVLMLVPIAALLIRLAVSRTREYGADEEGARLCGKPEALANALRKLERAVSAVPMQSGNPSTSHLFIVNPFRGVGLFELFSTHPPTQKRVERLLSLRNLATVVPQT
ncbi:MAG: M48 family metalloprotease [Candidatus Hadarchaeales archaeon]